MSLTHIEALVQHYLRRPTYIFRFKGIRPRVRIIPAGPKP